MDNLKELFTRNPFTIAWLSWFALFLFIEGMAIWSDVPRSTLSHQIRDWFRSQDLWVIILGWLFMLGLTGHFLLDLKS